MSKRTRFIILIFCIICFFVVAPVLVAYSMGYRFDFEKNNIVATGGIYVRTFPTADEITIDSNISEKPGFLANSIFVQSLLPKNHTIYVKKEGYHDYSKTLPVEEKSVTKLENVLLFKKNIKFEALPEEFDSPFDVQEKFLIKNNNLYYSGAPENSGISATKKSVPLLKNLVAFIQQNNNILWIGADGFLYKSDQSNLSAEAEKIILEPLKISAKGFYKIISDGRNTFVNNNGKLLFLNTDTNNLEDIKASIVKDAKISPDGKNLVYFNESEIYIYGLSESEPEEKNKTSLLYKTSKQINDCIWLNNDYIIFALSDRIIVSEIDYRGNVNNIVLAQSITLSDAASGVNKKTDIKNPKIYFNHQSGKLYVLNSGILLMSDKITP